MIVNQFRWQKDTCMSRGSGVSVPAHQSSFIRIKPYKIPVAVSSMTFSMKYKSTSVIHLKDDPIPNLIWMKALPLHQDHLPCLRHYAFPTSSSFTFLTSELPLWIMLVIPVYVIKAYGAVAVFIQSYLKWTENEIFRNSVKTCGSNFANNYKRTPIIESGNIL